MPKNRAKVVPSPLQVVDWGDGVRVLRADLNDPGVDYLLPATAKVRKVNNQEEANDTADADAKSPMQVIHESRKAMICCKAQKKRKQTLQLHQQEHDAA